DDLVPSREAREFKPLKTFLPKESPRGQPIEARSFQYCNSRIKTQNPNKPQPKTNKKKKSGKRKKL
ncbi:MAG: hypothetical protein ACK469_11205, partial [Bacteroidota bacterium]